MSIPYALELESGGVVRVSTVGSRVMMTVSGPAAVLTRAEAEEVGDMLWLAGVVAEPPASVEGRAKPITSVDDPRVRGG